MRVNFVSLIFFIIGCIAYAREISERIPHAPFQDARIDVVCIALLGLVAHSAFERLPRQSGTQQSDQ